MEHLFAPWRMQYILSSCGEDKKDEGGSGCIFCDFPKLDRDDFV